jgi:catechol 2,3-dioxygenase-like lactoylglutathione lyase family enzyme
MDMKFEVAVIPVSDVNRAKTFYESLGFRMDIDYVGADNFRVVQFTPPGSEASIIIGSNVTSAAPGSTQGLQLVVWDIEKAHEELVGRGIDVSDVFHDVGGIFHHAGTDGRVTGPAPDRNSYGSFLSFNDPDGNGWIIQEVQTRAPGR